VGIRLPPHAHFLCIGPAVPQHETRRPADRRKPVIQVATHWTQVGTGRAD